jgi:hypothetical protein
LLEKSISRNTNLSKAVTTAILAGKSARSIPLDLVQNAEQERVSDVYLMSLFVNHVLVGNSLSDDPSF